MNIEIYKTSLCYDFEYETLDNAIERLQEKRKQILDVHPECTRIEFREQYASQWDDSPTMMLVAYREETIAEVRSRKKKEREEKAKIEEAEFKQYQKLKEKFDKQ